MAETIVIKPVEISDPLVNPDCGWGIWVGPVSTRGRKYNVEDMTVAFGDNAPLFSFVCIDWFWRDLELQEGGSTGMTWMRWSTIGKPGASRST